MTVKEITASDNATLKRIRKLADRDERKRSGHFLVEGKRLIQEALLQNLSLANVVASRSFFQDSVNADLLSGIDNLCLVEDVLFKELYTTSTSCGVVAEAVQPSHSLEEVCTKTNPLVLIGDAVQDPGNLGTIMRNAIAFDTDCLILCHGSVDCFAPKVVRGSMGAIFRLPIIQNMALDDCLQQMAKRKIRTIALDPQGKSPYWTESPYQSCAFVFGNEGNGLSPVGLSKSDAIVRIPIHKQCESLNVAAAVGIVLSDVYRVRCQASESPR